VPVHGLLASVSLWFHGLGVAWRSSKARIAPDADERTPRELGM